MRGERAGEGEPFGCWMIDGGRDERADRNGKQGGIAVGRLNMEGG